MILRIIAIVFIYFCTAAAWLVLGGTVQHRTNVQDQKLRYAVGQLWGSVQHQVAPETFYETAIERKVETVRGAETITEIKQEILRNPVPIIGGDLAVDLDLEHRKKGLLWYPTYRVAFNGQYRVANPTAETRSIHFSFRFPAQGATYDDFQLLVDGKEMQDVHLSDGGFEQVITMPPGAVSTVGVGYVSRGMEEWWYNFGDNVNQIRNFNLVMTTDFDAIDFPQNSISPTAKTRDGAGWKLDWKFKNLLTGVEIGLAMPQKLNPGPWVSTVSYSAPISLFLFFFLLFFITTIRKIKVHPVNYFFIGAAFFSFHLLLSYLVDHISIHASFFISSAVSIMLVVSYMRLVVGARFAMLEVGVSQFVYLVFFSYTYFFEGYTGLAITILCIVTLFIVMQVSGRVDWEEVFQRKSIKPQANSTEAFQISPA